MENKKKENKKENIDGYNKKVFKTQPDICNYSIMYTLLLFMASNQYY